MTKNEEYETLCYEVRRYNDHGKHTWHLWRRFQKGRWPFRIRDWEIVAIYKSEKEAREAMIKSPAGHYDETEYFDKAGKQYFYGC